MTKNEIKFREPKEDPFDAMMNKPFGFYGSALSLNAADKVRICSDELIAHERGRVIELEKALHTLQVRCD